ncbi:hypothetical protein HG531_008116 [Fusarium graminearum]|nr:hypothetical protein HG531_008116 [Fusarium graminearum]
MSELKKCKQDRTLHKLDARSRKTTKDTQSALGSPIGRHLDHILTLIDVGACSGSLIIVLRDELHTDNQESDSGVTRTLIRTRARARAGTEAIGANSKKFRMDYRKPRVHGFEVALNSFTPRNVA